MEEYLEMRADIVEFAQSHLGESELSRLTPALEGLSAMLGPDERFIWLTDGVLGDRGILAICERGLVFAQQVGDPSVLPWNLVDAVTARPGPRRGYGLQVVVSGRRVVVDDVGERKRVEQFAEVIRTAADEGFVVASLLADRLEIAP